MKQAIAITKGLVVIMFSIAVLWGWLFPKPVRPPVQKDDYKPVYQRQPVQVQQPVFDESKAVAELTETYKAGIIEKARKNLSFITRCLKEVDDKATFAHTWNNKTMFDIFSSAKIAGAFDEWLVLSGNAMNNGIPYECWINLNNPGVVKVKVNGL